MADRLREYIETQKIGLQERIFPICYEAARSIVAKAGKLVGINLRPHDLRRHAATFASRSGVPLEIVSIMFPSSLFKPVDHSNIFGKDQRYRSAEMD